MKARATQCCQCGADIITGSRASEALCPECKTAKRRKDEWEKEFCAGYFVVDSCPNNEYRRGARFTKTEIDAMELEYGALVPGMILKTRTAEYYINDHGKKRRIA